MPVLLSHTPDTNARSICIQCAALYTSLIPPYIPCSFNYPDNGVNQELPDESPQKATSCYEIGYGRAKLVVQDDKLRAHGAFQQHHIPEFSQHIDLFSAGSSIGCGSNEAAVYGGCGELKASTFNHSAVILKLGFEIIEGA